MGKLKKWMFNILVSIDQLANAIAGGDPDETISSRCGKRMKTNKICCWICWALDKIDERHCHKYIDHTEGKDEVF